MRVWVPLDAAAKALGADAVAAALAQDFTVTRNGTRGMIWLEPLVEVERDGLRYGYGPVEAEDVPGLVAALRDGTDHPLALGPVEELPWMKAQARLTFARVGVIDPLSVEEYQAHGGLDGLRRAIGMGPCSISPP